MDNSHKLAVVADSDRIKTLFWGRAGDINLGDWTPARGQNVHTFKSGSYNGPLAVLPGGRIPRAGKGGVAIWDVKTLATHQGGKLVGEGKLNIDDPWRDDCEETVERSTLHDPSGHVLAADNAQRNSGRYGCYALDLESNGKKVMRFLGHGGEVDAFSISTGDANVFVTGCSDGYARLFDMRHPLPVMTLNPGGRIESCEAVSFIHPDGVPVVYTAGPRSASVKAWDIRVRASTYELATGNTAVRALSWDAKHNALYVAAECTYMGRNGNHFGYRRAKIPRWAREFVEETEPGMDVDEDEENWPERAYRQESFFGYAYDAGDHVLQDPDVKEIPEYGRGELEWGDFW
ncbi:hypothetical protein C8Q80DRAFT_1269875 [Daedaleopsis nitida]|nr:hypothetical protein C8Q80DRAFT_1269875 [Daedaleopsis nitida]